MPTSERDAVGEHRRPDAVEARRASRRYGYQTTPQREAPASSAQGGEGRREHFQADTIDPDQIYLDR